MEAETTQAQKVRDYLVHNVESQNLDIKKKEVRRKLIDEFKKENPEIKANAVESRFSKEFKSYAQAAGIPQTEIQAGQKKKVASKLISPQPQPAAAPNAVAINNPYVNPNAQQPAFMQQQPINPFGINERQVGAFAKSVFSIATAINPEIEDLTPDEQQDLGDLWTPLAQRHITGEKTHTIFAVGGTVGILARKIKEARRKKKEAEKEQENPNKAVIVEDSVNPKPLSSKVTEEDRLKKIGKKSDVVSEIES